MCENVQDIRARRKLYLESYVKLINVISYRRFNPSRSKNLSKHLIIAVTICYCNDTVELFTKKYQGLQSYRKK